MRVLLFFALVYCCRLHAQDSTIIIKAGTNFNDEVSKRHVYEYEDFTYGKVFFKTGDSTNAKLNYHRFLDAMLYIGFKGDTLKIINSATIKFICIKNDMFYYDDDNGYVSLINDTNGIKLARKRTLRISDRAKIGGYGMANPTSSITNYSTYFTQTSSYNLVPLEDITLVRKTEYYFGDKYNKFVIATKKNLSQKYSKNSKTVNTYLKDNNIDLNKKQDLEKLFEFLASL
jgi:hypothetical protein